MRGVARVRSGHLVALEVKLYESRFESVSRVRNVEGEAESCAAPSYIYIFGVFAFASPFQHLFKYLFCYGCIPLATMRDNLSGCSICGHFRDGYFPDGKSILQILHYEVYPNSDFLAP